MGEQSGCRGQLHALSSLMQNTFLLTHSLRSCSDSLKFCLFSHQCLESIKKFSPVLTFSTLFFNLWFLQSLYFCILLCSQDLFTISLSVQHTIHIIIKPTYRSLKNVPFISEKETISTRVISLVVFSVIVEFLFTMSPLESDVCFLFHCIVNLTTAKGKYD